MEKANNDTAKKIIKNKKAEPKPKKPPKERKSTKAKVQIIKNEVLHLYQYQDEVNTAVNSIMPPTRILTSNGIIEQQFLESSETQWNMPDIFEEEQQNLNERPATPGNILNEQNSEPFLQIDVSQSSIIDSPILEISLESSTKESPIKEIQKTRSKEQNQLERQYLEDLGKKQRVKIEKYYKQFAQEEEILRGQMKEVGKLISEL